MVGRWGLGVALSVLGTGIPIVARGASVVPMGLADSVSSALPIVGNVFGMIPKSMHASLLRNSLSVLSVM